MIQNDIPLIVIKIGSSSIVKHNGDNTEIDEAKIANLTSSIHDLKNRGFRVLLVSSGAVAAGAHILKIPRPKPDDIKGLAACASIGQPQLMSFYTEHAEKSGFVFSQVLLTRSDFHNQGALDYLEQTITSLFELGVVPILNENDVVSNRELNFGDNDGIASLVTVLLKANKFILLTDQDGLLDKDPNKHSDAKLIETIEEFTSSMVDEDAKLSSFGSGGAGAKVVAVDLATYANPGLEAFIANSNLADRVIDILEGKINSTRIKVKKTKTLKPVEAYEVFSRLETDKQNGNPYTPIACLLDN